ncbi:MAG: lipopolysaccharide transport periplasmic protein LptA [Pseudomonadota bacterium]
MRCNRRKWLVLITALLGLSIPSHGLTETSPLGIEKIGKGQPVIIKSDTLEIDNKRRIVTFEGRVEAKETDLTIKCRKMLLYYVEGKGSRGPDRSGIEIDRIVASGKVEIRRSDGGIATADEAVYYQKEEKVVLTGKPTVKQGDYFVEGSKITLFIKENRSVVEGSENMKVRAVMSPGNKEGGALGR